MAGYKLIIKMIFDRQVIGGSCVGAIGLYDGVRIRLFNGFFERTILFMLKTF